MCIAVAGWKLARLGLVESSSGVGGYNYEYDKIYNRVCRSGDLVRI